MAIMVSGSGQVLIARLCKIDCNGEKGPDMFETWLHYLKPEWFKADDSGFLKTNVDTMMDIVDFFQGQVQAYNKRQENAFVAEETATVAYRKFPLLSFETY